MDTIRHAWLLRLFFAALTAFVLMLNGMGSTASAGGGQTSVKFVLIAGTVITLCQYGGADGTGDKAFVVHGCDQCALFAAPTAPPVDLISGIERYPLNMVPRRLVIPVTEARLLRLPAWPRGPPVA
jgi:hypothetical protein